MASLRTLCFLSLAASTALAQLKVMTPEWLVSKLPSRGRVEGSTATFGAPYYGDRILGQIVWGESLKGKAHCTEDDYDVPPPPEHASLRAESKKVSLINIVMVRRGQCSFVTKVKVAAKKGAHAVIIVDREDSTLTGGDLHENIIVADDGYGDQIHIPSVLVSKDDGAKLIDAVRRSKVIVELAWEVPVNHVVDVDMWMSSASAKSMDFIKAFAEKRKALKKVVTFTPHYTVFSMDSSDPGVYNDLCLDANGEFCAEDPDGSGLVTGREVLQENVRQLCIHEMSKVQHSAGPKASDAVAYAQKFWDYMERLPDQCPLDGQKEEARFGEVCSEKLMHSVGINAQDVHSCVETTMKEKLQHERENKAWSPRALRINGWRYSGNLDADLVTRAICAGFHHEPPECGLLLADRNPFDPESYKNTWVASRVSYGTFLTIVLVGAGLAAGVFLLYQRALKRRLHTAIREEVMLEVSMQMGDYKRMPQTL